jgi:shikimate 5-dehydrogenase
LQDYRIAVIGAGGTGRTPSRRCRIRRDRRRLQPHQGACRRAGERIRRQTGKVVSARLEKLCDSCCHIFINTTSVGMHPNVDASPLGDRPPKFTPETLVFDTIYNPMRTKLLTQAEQAGAQTIGGVEMFVRQAVGQFEAWTGKPAPADLMRRVIEQRLAPHRA